MTKQKGSSDCGLFCIAVATSLCRKENPSQLYYIQDYMRKHFYNCCINGHMAPFPSLNVISSGIKLQEEFDVHCICRQPRVPGTRMIMCHLCERLYHLECMSVPPVEGYICRFCVPVTSSAAESDSDSAI